MKKGFTLVELLAVLVILAVILLIAIPIVQKTIYDSKISANKASIDLYGRAADQAIERYQMNERKNPTSFSDIEEYIEYSGDRVVCSTKRINDDMTVYLADCKVGEDDVEDYVYGIEPMVYENGEVVYFNVKDGVKCSESDYNEDNSKTGYNGLLDRKTTENQNSCLKFYKFNETSEKVNLLLDHNTTAIVAWNSSGSNTSGPNELLTQLATDTSGWSTNILTPTNYTSPSKGYTVNYTTRARLITAQEIAEITGNSDWKEESTSASYYYFDTLNQTDPTEYNYGWLYDRTETSCTNNGCLHNADSGMTGYGYWTVSADASFSYEAWYVSSYGGADINDVDFAGGTGVRPVIEVAKSSLN